MTLVSRGAALTCLALSAATLAGCGDGPCGQIEGPLLFAWDEGSAHRLVGTNASAFDSIGAALDAAEPGTAVCVGPGVWQEELRIDTDGVRLFGAGSQATIIEPLQPHDDPRASEATIIEVDAAGVLLSGLQVRGGAIGISLDGESDATLLDIEARTNEIGLRGHNIAGLIAEGLTLTRNTTAGAILSNSDPANAPGVMVHELTASGNGDMNVSAVGGFSSEHPLTLTMAHFVDNSGVESGDLKASAGLEVDGMLVESPFLATETPRVVIDGDATLRNSSFTLQKGGVEIDCKGGDLLLENVAVSNSSETPTDTTLSLLDCDGQLVHVTLARLDGPAQGEGFSHEGDGELEVLNSAIVNFAVPMGGNGAIVEGTNYTGILREAELLMPLSATPDLRPQLDSPLVDAGEELGLTRDLDGWQRPLGPAPDLGAYERR